MDRHQMQLEVFQQVRAELETAVVLPKCQKCGCMAGALTNLASVLPKIGGTDALALAKELAVFHQTMRPIQYACLGCATCYPAVAQNAFALAFPALSLEAADLSCEFRVDNAAWPPVVGEYFVVDKEAVVAVSTLASVELAEALAQRQPAGLAIVGKTETENIGIDKVIKNVVASPTIRYLIVAGLDAQGHLTGKTLLALAENGVAENGRIVGAPGKRPFLRNVSVAEIGAFREQVQLIDMIGCEDPDDICAQIETLAQQAPAPCGCGECGGKSTPLVTTAPILSAAEPDTAVTMDKAGYFVIMPLADRGVIYVEHYAYDHALLRVIEGADARAVYHTIIENGWVTELSHAAYLGKELVKAELSMQHGFKYVQDGA